MVGRTDFVSAIDIALQTVDHLTQRNVLGKLYQVKNSFSALRGDDLLLADVEGKGIFLSAVFDCEKACAVSIPDDEIRVIIDTDYEYYATPSGLYSKKAFVRYSGGIALSTYNAKDGIWGVYFDINQTFEVGFQLRYKVLAWAGMDCDYEMYYCKVEET